MDPKNVTLIVLHKKFGAFIKRRLILFLKAVGILMGILILVISTKYIYRTIPKTDSFFVKDAQFFRVEFSDYLPENETRNLQTPLPKPLFQAQNHWISPGQGIVFGWRYFSNGSVLTPDDELYQKLTIWALELPDKKIAFGDKTKIIGYYSYGGSAWPRGGCGGEIVSGTLQTIDQSDSKVRLKILGVVNCIDARNNETEKTKLDKTITFKKIEYSAITPWLGKQGGHIYHETYR